MASSAPNSKWTGIVAFLLLCGVLAKLSRVIWREYGPVNEEQQAQIQQMKEVSELLNRMKRDPAGARAELNAHRDSVPVEDTPQESPEPLQTEGGLSQEHNQLVETYSGGEPTEAFLGWFANLPWYVWAWLLAGSVVAHFSWRAMRREEDPRAGVGSYLLMLFCWLIAMPLLLIAIGKLLWFLLKLVLAIPQAILNWMELAA